MIWLKKIYTKHFSHCFFALDFDYFNGIQIQNGFNVKFGDLEFCAPFPEFLFFFLSQNVVVGGFFLS